LQDRIAAVVDQVDNIQTQSLTKTRKEIQSDDNERRVRLVAPIRILRPCLEFKEFLLDDLETSLEDAGGVGSE
jgi:hypothetical protein